MKVDIVVKVFICVCLWRISNARFGVYVKNNGYRGIIVTFSPEVESSARHDLISNTETLFKEASKFLFSISHRHFYFDNVTFLIPKSWGASKNWGYAPALYPTLGRYGDADIHVFPGIGITGYNPYTIQHGGCKQTGHRIYLPEKFVQGRTQAHFKAFIHEWTRYRYGVFDESGFPGDPIYPQIYQVSGTDEIKLSVCSNMPVNYSLVDGTGNECEFGLNQNGTVEESCYVDRQSVSSASSSSLMSMHILPNVGSYCRESSNYRHLIHAPTKHNVLCDYKSIWETIRSSGDFENVEHKGPLPGTNFHYVQEGDLRIAVVYSYTLPSEDVYDQFKSALTFFIKTILPDGTHASHRAYSNDEQDKENLGVETAQLNGTAERDTLARNIESYGFPKTSKPNVWNAVSKLIEALQYKDILRGTTMILVTGGDIPDVGRIKKIIEDKQIRLNLILTPGAITNSVQDLATMHDVKIFSILDFQKEPLEAQFLNALLSTLDGHSSQLHRYVTAERIFDLSKQPSPVEYQYAFPVEKNVERLILRMYDKSHVGHKTIRFLLNDVQHNQSSSREKEFVIPHPKDGIANLTFETREVPDDQKGHPLIIQAVCLFVNDPNIITVRSWINQNSSQVEPRQPLIFYVEVLRGTQPVMGARVIVTVSYNNITADNYHMELLDNGLGDPDVTANDGLYTRYFTAFKTRGFYYLSFSVDDNDGNAAVVINTRGTDRFCCGSVIPGKNNATTGAFTRTSKFGSFYVDSNIPDNDIYHPNQITDLKVQVLSHWERRVRLTWTAPGDNYDSSDQVKHYRIKYYRTMEEALKRQNDSCANDLHDATDFNTSNALCVELNDFNTVDGPSLSAKVRYGETEIRNVKLNPKYFLGNLFFVIYAIDSNNNTSPRSNIAAAFVYRDPPPTVDPTGENPSPDPPEGSQGLSNAEIGMIVGIILGVLALIAIAILIFVLYRRRKKRKSKDNSTTAGPQTISSSRMNGVMNGAAISESNSWSASVLMDHYEKTRQPSKNSRPIVSIGDVLANSDSEHSSKNELYEPAYGARERDQVRSLPFNPSVAQQQFQNSTPKKMTEV